MRVPKTLVVATCTLVGGAVGLVAGVGWAESHRRSNTSDAVSVGLMVSGPVAGFMLARRLGRRS